MNDADISKWDKISFFLNYAVCTRSGGFFPEASLKHSHYTPFSVPFWAVNVTNAKVNIFTWAAMYDGIFCNWHRCFRPILKYLHWYWSGCHWLQWFLHMFSFFALSKEAREIVRERSFFSVEPAYHFMFIVAQFILTTGRDYLKSFNIFKILICVCWMQNCGWRSMCVCVLCVWIWINSMVNALTIQSCHIFMHVVFSGICLHLACTTSS